MSNCEQTATCLLGMFPFTLAVCLKPVEMTLWPAHEHFTSLQPEVLDHDARQRVQGGGHN
jgi:hypothetical protein